MKSIKFTFILFLVFIAAPILIFAATPPYGLALQACSFTPNPDVYFKIVYKKNWPTIYSDTGILPKQTILMNLAADNVKFVQVINVTVKGHALGQPVPIPLCTVTNLKTPAPGNNLNAPIYLILNPANQQVSCSLTKPTNC